MNKLKLMLILIAVCCTANSGFAQVGINTTTPLSTLDINGNLIIQTEYESATNFYEGFAAVERNGKWGFINNKGEQIVDFIYQDVARFSNVFSEGLASVKLNNKWGFINHEGQVKIDFVFDNTGVFSEGICEIYSKGKWGFINKAGFIAIKPEFERVSPFKKGLAKIWLHYNESLWDYDYDSNFYQEDIDIQEVYFDEAYTMENDWYVINNNGNKFWED